MSETNIHDPNEWVWQGFEAPMSVAVAVKAITDSDQRVGAWVPIQGAPPLAWNKAKTKGMWAVMVRRGNPLPVPDGCEEADEFFVGRMVGA